jgi:ubiquinone/menaquinone biosynthesis C-methylase UbiE
MGLKPIMEYKASIEKTKQSFERSFAEKSFYNSQTQDSEHLNRILDSLDCPSNGRILDLGSGSGYLTFSIAQRHPCAFVTGLDIVEKALENCRLREREQGLANLDFISYDGTAFPFAANTFDIVVTRYALHHFPDIKRAFSEIGRVLKPGGQLFLSDPTPNEGDKNRFADTYMQMKDDGHIKFYTMEEFMDTARCFDMELESSFCTDIRFPRKMADGYSKILEDAGKDICKGYEVSILGGEIFITEKVLNLSFRKRKTG